MAEGAGSDRAVADEYGSVFEMSPQAIFVDVPSDIEGRADDLLDEVVGNLLTNAVEHGPESPHIEVTAVDRPGTDTVELRIAGDGPGIPAGRRDRLLRRGETAGQSGGRGFGLYFVNSMVEAYGGRVTISDSHLGGAAFRLALPRPAHLEQSGGLSWD